MTPGIKGHDPNGRRANRHAEHNTAHLGRTAVLQELQSIIDRDRPAECASVRRQRTRTRRP